MRQNVFAFILICLLLGACGDASPQPTQTTRIGQNQAFAAAREGCNRGHIREIDPPNLVDARLMGYHQAESILNCPYSNCTPTSPLEPGETLAWLVTLEGRWQLVGGPPPLPTPTGQPPLPTDTPTYFHLCRTIVDATTGEVDSNQLFQ